VAADYIDTGRRCCPPLQRRTAAAPVHERGKRADTPAERAIQVRIDDDWQVDTQGGGAAPPFR
jgi:hypothetical protein